MRAVLLRSGLFKALNGWNLPVLKLFKELDLVVVVHEVGVQLAVVSEVIQDVEEGLSVSI